MHVPQDSHLCNPVPCLQASPVASRAISQLYNLHQSPLHSPLRVQHCSRVANQQCSLRRRPRSPPAHQPSLRLRRPILRPVHQPCSRRRSHPHSHPRSQRLRLVSPRNNPPLCRRASRRARPRCSQRRSPVPSQVASPHRYPVVSLLSGRVHIHLRSRQRNRQVNPACSPARNHLETPRPSPRLSHS